MDDDFNTANAVAVLFDFTRTARDWLGSGLGREDALAADTLFLRLAGEGLGLSWSAQGDSDLAQRQDAVVKLLIELRQEARKAKNFTLSDQIRNRLLKVGIELRDGSQGTTWGLAQPA